MVDKMKGGITATCGHREEIDNPHYHVLYEDSWVDAEDGIVKGEVSAIVCERCLPNYKKWYNVLSIEYFTEECFTDW